MHKTIEKTEKICEMVKKLLCWTESELSKGVQDVNTEETGEVIDMIKDLAEAEEKCWKACYYKKIVEAMEEHGKEDFDEEEIPWYLKMFGRAGYDSWRYSSGRFAPKGRGHRTGYIPPYDMTAMPGDGYEDWENPRMGYDTRGGGSMQSTGQYGTNYNRYKNARRHYTQTGSQEDRKEMSESAKMHVMEATETMRDIWKDADPELRNKMKTDLNTLMGEMK